MTVLSSSSSTAVPRSLGAGLVLVILIVAFESMAVSTVLPRVADDLQGLALYGWASSAFLLASLFGAVWNGQLTDRRGLAFGAALSLGIFAVGLLVGGIAPTMTVFVLGRLIQGLGAGGLAALPFAVITTRYPEALRARMLATVSTAWLLPALLGPLIASLIADTWSWRTVFWGLVPVLLLSAPLCLWPLRAASSNAGGSSAGMSREAEPSPAPAASRPRPLLWPALWLSLSTAALVEGLRRADALGWGLAALGGLGLVWSGRLLFPAGLLRLRPGLPAALAVRGFAAFGLLGMNAVLPLALHELRGLSLTQAGTLLSVGGATWTLGSWVQARLERRWGPASRPGRVRVGMLGMVLGLCVTAAGVMGALPLWAAYAGWLLSGLSMGIGYNSNSLFVLSAAGDDSGQVSGQLANIEVLMVAVAAGAAGALIARVEPLSLAFLLSFALTIGVGLLTWLAASRLLPRR